MLARLRFEIGNTEQILQSNVNDFDDRTEVGFAFPFESGSALKLRTSIMSHQSSEQQLFMLKTQFKTHIILKKVLGGIFY